MDRATNITFTEDSTRDVTFTGDGARDVDSKDVASTD